MRLTTKLGSGFALITTMLLVASVTGLISVNHLPASLDNIMGFSWDTADGAMEGRISIQQQIVTISEVIEASRAGEQGRGFAVVADEIRTLASRTQHSPSEIQAMIERLQTRTQSTVAMMEEGRRQTEEWVKQAAEAGHSLSTITCAVGPINEMNALIARTAEEQSSVAEEMSRNITSINDLSTQRAESSNQTAMASENLTQLATELQRLVGQFKT